MDAAQFDDSILVERFVAGREVAVGLLDGRALGGIEIVPRGNFYDYRSKYQAGQSEYHFPARLTPTRYKGILNIAERAAACLGVTGAARADLLVTEGENEYVLEVNTLPGLTPTSLLPKIAAGAGYDFGDLCEAILERATLGCAEARGEGVGTMVVEQPAVALAR
jgi:D-alanine-D-alanine ligase